MSPAPQLRILIADDHPVFRSGMKAMLASVADFKVVGEAGSGAEAIAIAAAEAPDVAVLDIHMPDVDGIEATRTIVSSSPKTAVLVLTMTADDDTIFATMRAGARGYLTKGADRETIIASIQAVARGEAIFGPAIAERMLAFFSRPGQAQALRPFPELTDREHEILELIARGLGNAEITRQLVLSPKTVRNHVSNIFGKLSVADRAEAIVRAREAGIGRETD